MTLTLTLTLILNLLPFVILPVGIASAALPPDMQELLDSLPGKTLSVDVVLGRAIESSDSFKAILAQRATLDVPRLQAEIPLESRFAVNGTVSRDRREPLSPFQPNRIDTQSISLEYQKYFSSGTALSATLSHGKTDLGFASLAPPGFVETRAEAVVSQNLWQDSFGRATRLGQEAGSLASEAAALGLQDSVDEWVLGIIQIYYGAWLSQAQHRAAAEALKRRERLIEITRIKSRRGTAEQPDLLQAQSALLNATVQRDQTAQALGDRWRGLVVSLKLPSAWIGVDPAEIPIALDERVQEALSSCGPESSLRPVPADTAAVRRAALLAKAADLNLEAARNAARPDLELRGGVATNGVDPEASETLSETFTGKHPAWNLGVRLSFPIGFIAEEARVRSAIGEQVRADALAGQAADQQRVDWISRCLDLYRAQRAHDSYKAAFESQRRRAEIEEARFRIGRVPMLQVIQAGDDATQAEISLSLSEVERRSAAWKVLRLTNQVQGYVRSLSAKERPRS